MKTAQTIEQANSEQAPKRARRGKHGHPNSLKNLVAPWKRGKSGNPSGKPGYDVAAHLCRQAIENNQQAIYEGLSAGLIGGNAYLLSVTADRGYGKNAQKVIHQGDENGGPVRTSIKVEFVTTDGK